MIWSYLALLFFVAACGVMTFLGFRDKAKYYRELEAQGKDPRARSHDAGS